jgi:hypothetical protein
MFASDLVLSSFSNANLEVISNGLEISNEILALQI